MKRPRVTIHNMASVDGRLDGYGADVGLYYELAGELPHQAVLAGSTTMLAAAAAEGVDMSAEDPWAEPTGRAEPAGAAGPAGAGDGRPWLVVVDSGGRLTRFAWLRGQPYWRELLVVCAAATPAAQLDRLRRHAVPHIVAGLDRVDLGALLGVLAERYGVAAVRVDAGGTLNGALLRSGLVDEVSVVVAPYLVGSRVARPLPVVDGLAEGDARRLRLVSVQRLRDDHVWLRYQVTGVQCADHERSPG